ncbi:MAG: CTP-dependent riboflavin kinase [Candidatus Woesearchaeota archaeon]|nr:CTP-dependent riboflavin kinase [Candidatus Woesearchaeota archaeon]
MFAGVVTSGLGEGAQYVEKYNKYFQEVLGVQFFPGTVNLKVRERPAMQNGTIVTPEEDGLFPVTCYPATCDEKQVFVVSPRKTEHGDDIVELLATENLRESLHLQDGDELQCELD